MDTPEHKKGLYVGNFEGNFLKTKVTKVTGVSNFLFKVTVKVTEKVTAINPVITVFLILL